MKSDSFTSIHEIVVDKCELELISVELTTTSRTKLCICCCYRPPNSNRNWFQLLPQASGVITDHNCLIFHFKATVKAPVKLNRFVYDYHKGDFEGLRSTLQNIDFSKIVESNTDVNAAWLEWKERYIATVRNFIPMKKIKGKSSPPWITGHVLYMIRKKESLRKKLRSSSLTYLIAKFKQLRSTVKRMISETRARYFESLEQDIQSNPKRFWSAFKLSDKESSVPQQVSIPSTIHDTVTGKLVRKLVSNPVEIAEIFNNHFTSIFANDIVEPRPQLPPTSGPTFSEISLSPCEVVAALRSLDVTKASGPDEISARLLKETAEQNAPSLTLLYNQSLKVTPHDGSSFHQIAHRALNFNFFPVKFCMHTDKSLLRPPV